MPIDFIYLKKILNTMKDKSGYVINADDLFEETKPLFSADSEQLQFERFFGHLLLLLDNGMIAELSPSRYRLGLQYSSSGIASYCGAQIRLTSDGYAFSDALNESAFLQKIKGFSLAAAAEAGKLLLQKLIL